MNKKLVFVVGIVLVSLLFAGGVGYLIYNLTNYSDTMDEYEQIEQDKTILTNASDVFENQEEKYSNISVSSKKYTGGKYSITKEGIQFKSYVQEWDKSMLEDLADEFFRNAHGDEIQYIELVELQDAQEYEDLYSSYDRDFRIPITLYGFLDKDAKYFYTEELATITVTGSEYIWDVDTMAYYMSFAYGQHFVKTRLGLEGTEDDAESEYYALRAKDDDRVKLEETKYNDENENFQWYLENIAALDYVYLMGSDTIKEDIDNFLDTMELLKFSIDADDDTEFEDSFLYAICRNGLPHDNYDLPMPHEVEGLKEYFYSFVDDEAPEFTVLDEEIGDLNLKYEPYSGSSYKKGKITWDKPFEDDDVVYTVLLFDSEGELWSMYKTVSGDEEAEAIIGECRYRNWIFSTGVLEGFEKGEELIVRVTVTFPDGTVVVSDPIEIIYQEGMKE